MKGTCIVVTYNCNIMCSNCIYKCGPHRKGIMKVADFARTSQAAADDGYGDYISICGGEPFMHSGIIYKYLKSISSINTWKKITTNGYWGNSDPYLSVLTDFKDIGLNEIVIEYDYLHSLFINIKTIANAIEYSKKAGLEVTLRSLFITNNISSSADIETFQYIKDIKEKYKYINLIFDVLDGKKENKLADKNKEKIVLYDNKGT